MKLFFLVIIFSIISIARENPFEPTKTFLQLVNKESNISIAQTNTTIKQTVKQKAVVQQKQSKCKKSYDYTPLKFISIQLKENSISLNISKKYKFKQQVISEDNTKFIFDFEGNKTFYTIRQKLCNNHFKYFAIGTHLEDNFFRIVVKANKPMNNFSLSNIKNQIDIKTK